MEGVALHRVGILGFLCPKQGQGLKPSVTPLYPNMGQVHSPPPSRTTPIREINLVCGTKLILTMDCKKYFSK